MSKHSKEQLLETNLMVTEAEMVAAHIVELLKSNNVEMRVGVLACGMAFSQGAVAMGASLPTTIEVIRSFYKHESEQHATH